MRYPVKFVDHALGDTYAWRINYSTMDARGKSRAVEATASSRPGTSLLLQQGADQPMEIKVGGTILDMEQRAVFIIWFQRCESHTIEFHDFDGSIYEVVITDFQDPWRRVAMNPRQRGTATESAVVDYSLSMTVIRVVSGPWSVVTP
jgi:hypothetical protein